MTNKILFFLLSISIQAYSQPQWKFPIAFEDGIGARDTIWYIWDSSATFNADTALGEGHLAFDHTSFNVFVFSPSGDSVKTVAFPLAAISIDGYVHAINFQYPVTISWDTSLFQIPFAVGFPNINQALIDNDYFFGVNNDPPLQAYNMLIDTSAFAPSFNWGSQSHFPAFFYIARDPSLSDANAIKNKINVYPNPFENYIYIENNSEITEIKIIDFFGKRIHYSGEKQLNYSENVIIPTDELQSGVYFIQFTTSNNNYSYEKIIKP